MNDWRKPCEHGFYDAHPSLSLWQCPGGSPVTAADLEGEKVWRCRDAFGNVRYLDEPCSGADSAEGCGWRFLIWQSAEGEKVWQHGPDCLSVEYGVWQIAPDDDCNPQCGGGWRLLIPIPDPVDAE